MEEFEVVKRKIEYDQVFIDYVRFMKRKRFNIFRKNDGALCFGIIFSYFLSMMCMLCMSITGSLTIRNVISYNKSESYFTFFVFWGVMLVIVFLFLSVSNEKKKLKIKVEGRFYEYKVSNVMFLFALEFFKNDRFSNFLEKYEFFIFSRNSKKGESLFSFFVYILVPILGFFFTILSFFGVNYDKKGMYLVLSYLYGSELFLNVFDFINLFFIIFNIYIFYIKSEKEEVLVHYMKEVCGLLKASNYRANA